MRLSADPRPSLQRWLRAERGNIAFMAAVIAPVALLMGAMAIDTGAIAGQKRKLQGLADMAAIAAAASLQEADRVVLQTLDDNGFAGIAVPAEDDEAALRAAMQRAAWRVTVETGRYVPDPDAGFVARFRPDAEPANAVRVSLSEAPVRYFSVVRPKADPVTASGLAAVSSEAAISVGSRLLSLEDGLLNALLQALTGSEVELTVMDYRSLASADIDLLGTLDALNTNLDLQAATYDEVLDSVVTLDDLTLAMAEAAGDDIALRHALHDFAGSDDLDHVRVPLKALIGLGSLAEAELGSEAPGLDLSAGALQVLTASAIAAGGDRQVALDLGASVPGLASVSLVLDIGERPQSHTWYSLSEQGRTTVSTVQLRLSLDATVEGFGLLSHEVIRLPLHIELASADARVREVVCEPGETEALRVDVDVQPAALSLRIADRTNGTYQPARLMQTSLLTVDGYGESRMENPAPDRLRFYPADIGGDPKSTSVRSALSSALRSALTRLELDVELGRFSLISDDSMAALVASVLGHAVDPLEEVVFNITSALGIELGEADVWVHDARCNRSVLVQ